MVWGCMAANGVGRLEVVSGMMNGTKYIDVLERKMLPSARSLFSDNQWIFQDDNAPCHRARRSRSGMNLIRWREWNGRPNHQT